MTFCLSSSFTFFLLQCQEKSCTWAAIDYATTPPARRNLKAVFPTNQIAEEMFNTFKEVSSFCNDLTQVAQTQPNTNITNDS